MFKWIAGRLDCLGGKHVRAGRRAHWVGKRYESRCQFCGVAMVRLAKRNWIVKTD